MHELKRVERYEGRTCILEYAEILLTDIENTFYVENVVLSIMNIYWKGIVFWEMANEIFV